ncbi:hypothetical protein Golomagni_05746 [Golovinomyces magnicellulatus]|nr:hypothetical protein Golomagni_05746 [Golovinomyces magnicellulatus]
MFEYCQKNISSGILMKLTNILNGTYDSGHTFLVLIRNIFNLTLVSTSTKVMFYNVSAPVRQVMVLGDRRWILGEVDGVLKKAEGSSRMLKEPLCSSKNRNDVLTKIDTVYCIDVVSMISKLNPYWYNSWSSYGILHFSVSSNKLTWIKTIALQTPNRVS